MKLLFIVDRLESFQLAGDTSYALMLEAARRGWEVWSCQIEHLDLVHDDAVADVRPTQVVDAATPADAFTLGDAASRSLGDFDMVLMRKDPPVDIAFLHATMILEHARGKTLLINDPRGLRELNEHLAVLRFPTLTPPTIVTRSVAKLRAFKQDHGGTIVVKPIDGFGGMGIFVVRAGDPNASSILETSTGGGTRWTIAQQYLPEVVEGDKRILLADGEFIGAVLRVPAAAEARGNLHVGGRPVKCDLDARDREIIAAVTPTLRQFGQIFVGLDVIGGMLTELNITSPTGVRHVDQLEHRNSSAPILDCFARLAGG